MNDFPGIILNLNPMAPRIYRDEFEWSTFT